MSTHIPTERMLSGDISKWTKNLYFVPFEMLYSLVYMGTHIIKATVRNNEEHRGLLDVVNEWEGGSDMQQDLYSQKNLDKTAEEYRKEAQKHQEAAKEMQKSFLMTGVFMIAAIVALFVFSMAWFYGTRQTIGGGMNFTIEDPVIELRSYGHSGTHDDLFQIISSSITYGTSEDGILGRYTTGKGKDSVNWLLSDESNMNNDEQIQWSDTTKERKEYAIEPGAEGKLKFYLVPHKSGAQTACLNLTVTGYIAAIGADSRTVEDAKLLEDGDTDNMIKDYLKHHILFYLEKDGEDFWIKNGTFLIQLDEDTLAEQEYEYTLHWIWPQTFAQIALAEGDRFLNGKIPILTHPLRDEILEEMTEKPELFFYNSLTKRPLAAGDSRLTQLERMHPENHTLPEEVAQDFVDLASFYNQADQKIGSRVSFILVDLNVQEGGN